MQPTLILEDAHNPSIAEAHAHLFEMCIPSTYVSMERTVRILEDVLKHFEFPEEDRVNVLVAFSEAVANAILHGNRECASKQVHIRVQTGPSQATIWVRDEGEGFDVAAVVNPPAEENLLAPSGRGIVMMQAFMDQVEFFHVGEGMLVKMTKYFGLPERSQDGSCERLFSVEEADAGPSKDGLWWAGCCDPRLDQIAVTEEMTLKGLVEMLGKCARQWMKWVDLKTQGIANIEMNRWRKLE